METSVPIAESSARLESYARGRLCYAVARFHALHCDHVAGTKYENQKWISGLVASETSSSFSLGRCLILESYDH